MIKNFFTRKRTWGVWGIPVVVIALLFWTDPDRGGSTRDMLVNFITVGIAFTAAHFLRKFFFDYIKLSDHVQEAKKGNIASAIVVLAVTIFICVAALIFSTRAHAQDVRTYVPAAAERYCPMLQDQRSQIWQAHPMPAALCSLAELESCPHMKHARCWSPTSRLKTDREEGAGFGQITRAYHKDGSLRFDALATTKLLDAGLSEWSWSNVYQRPDLQLRAIVVINRDCYMRLSRLVKEPSEVLRMCDAAYNGGYAGMQSERRACGQRPGCDPQKWVGNVEHVCLKSKVRWKGYGQSACEINREHVFNVFDVRYQKYVRFVQVKT